MFRTNRLCDYLREMIPEKADDEQQLWKRRTSNFYNKTIDTTRTTLREITDYVLLYTELEPCLTCIRSIVNERILLIISDNYAELCLDKIHDLPQVHSVFVFCMKVSQYKQRLFDWNRYSKIIDVFDNEDLLINSIRLELNDLQRHLLTFSFYDRQRSVKDLSRDSASFLWFQLFKDVLFEIPSSEQTKDELIDQCSQYYQGNSEVVENIEAFIEKYTEQNAVEWYRKKTFISRLCKKAFRVKDIEILFLFRNYLQDLCRQIDKEHDYLITRELDHPTLIFYRGIQLNEDVIIRFQSHIGSLVTTNGFLFSTRHYNTALQSALKTTKHSPEISPVLFIIQTNIHHDHITFVDTSSPSTGIKCDEDDDGGEEGGEILFGLGCAFKINEVYFDKNRNVWIVNISSSNEARSIVESYMEETQYEVEKGNPLLLFGSLLTEMRQYHQSQIYWNMLLSSNIIEDQTPLLTNTGRVKYHQGLYDEALRDFQTVYDLQHDEKPINHRILGETMHFLGLIYSEQKNYDLALDYFFDVFKIHKQHTELSDLLLANTNNAIGIVFTHKHDYDQALKYLLRAMKLYEMYFSTKDHSAIAANYNGIGLAFYYTKQHEQALEYCLEALHIREEVLPGNHSHIADSCNNVALIYHHLFEFDQAYQLFQRALKIYENDIAHKMRIPICLNNIGLLHLDQSKYEQAIEYYLQALEFYKQEDDDEKFHEEICFTLDNLGIAYEMKSDYDNALKYYQCAYEKEEEDSSKSIRILIRIGNIYHKKGDNEQALVCYQNALDKSENCPSDLVASVLMSMGIIYHRQKRYELALDTYKRVIALQKHLSSNHELDLAWTYNNLGCLYDDMGDMKRALRYQQRAYDIRRKFLQSTHPDLAISLNNLGRIHQALSHLAGGDPLEAEQALQNYKAALHIRRKSLANDHPDLAISYYNLALVHVDQQEYEQAYSEIQKALNIQRKRLPNHHPDLEQTLKLEKRIRILLDYRQTLARYT
ncbi:unnamed protein product [Adineta ricciae]|nr:unnamed protein product [Adineta ricciae]